MATRREAAPEEHQEGGAGPLKDGEGLEQPDQGGNEADGEQLHEGEGSGIADEMEEDEMEEEQADDEDEESDEEESESDDSEDNRSSIDGDFTGYEEVEYEEEAIDTLATVPDGRLSADDIVARFPRGTNDMTGELTLGIIDRTVTSPQQVTRLIEQGADLSVIPRLRRKGNTGRSGCSYPLVVLAIDNNADCTIPSALSRPERFCEARPVALPQWPSDELQSAVLTARIDGGADINATGHDDEVPPPIWVAIRGGNLTAFDLLMAQDGIDLRRFMVMMLPRLRRPHPATYEAVLLSIRYREHYSRSFIASYLDLVIQHGADIHGTSTGWNCREWTPLNRAAHNGSAPVVEYLCRKLPTADDINRRIRGDSTALSTAVSELDERHFELHCIDDFHDIKLWCRRKIPDYELTIRILLRAGADITSYMLFEGELSFPAVLNEYSTVLKEMGPASISAVNAALAPHRSLSALLTPRLRGGPQEAPVFGWRIASYLLDMAAAQEAITEAIGMRHSVLVRRVCAAAEHFVHLAVYKASSNREVVGGMADVGGQVVRTPQLQCFVVGGVGGRKMELREVVQRAILDEAAKWGLVGEIDNGFTKDVPAIDWGAVGWVDKGRDGRETFRRLHLV
ncbi:unnamed protein product [Vitrella brassicaformis CCMP3155]|uniref:Uncharacterized protein n=1 Tax=Vitrella brassicaformis (strain CCMP3155) TaxID=1169540 RepID=A0A0G4EQW4_VITBC|nr:unnamed protein product [Vitrella brassicaformis CCMP3155]|eukprot:CEL99645.1 unnamed protein product [Vitrella brassicaformis CCMP3155]